MSKKKNAVEIEEMNTATENEELQIYGARVHNLKNIDVVIPRNKLVVITGLSGSGKSSLAFDTIYAEGQRRYMESFSAYARQFIGDMERPDVDQISGLSPVISIEQKSTGNNPRSTVGTITEIYDFLRLLYARAADAFSYETGKSMKRFTPEQILQSIREQYADRKITILSPVVRGRKGHYRELFEEVRKKGYLKIRVDGKIVDLMPKMQLDRYKVHDIELVIDRIELGTKSEDRLEKSIATALKQGKGLVFILDEDSNDLRYYSQHLMDPETGLAYEDPSPNTFSFNSPYGYCQTCKGLGYVYDIDLKNVIPDYSKSINEQAILPMGEVRDNYMFDAVRDIAKRYKFSFATPIQDIPVEALNLILYGNKEGIKTYGDEEDSVERQFYMHYSDGFRGVLPMVYRFYLDSSSEGVRRWAEEFISTFTCKDCDGKRLKKEALSYLIAGKNISELSDMQVNDLKKWFDELEPKLEERQKIIARDVLKEIRTRIQFLLDVGLDYLTLNRPARSMSGGEAQRIRLATQIGSQLTGITYILDEPSIGLHQRDNHRLIGALKELRDVGNTVIVVEHDKDMMLEADYIIDLGPGAGEHGGRIVAAGTPQEFKAQSSLTSKYLNNSLTVPIPQQRRAGNGKELRLEGAKGHNLKNVSVSFPLGKLILITGVSGSGKSSLINETLYPILKAHFYNSRQKPLPYTKIDGLKYIDKVIEIDQSPIGRTPRSNPATYVGVFTDIRDLFAQLPEAKIRGYKPGRFSFNVKGGRCEECQGAGLKTIEMNFLPDVHVQCDKCGGKRYNRETLEVRYRGKSIADVLDMTIEEAVSFFENMPRIYKKIKTIYDVGLGYIKLGQQATTLSGGEAQRVKLSTELSKNDTGNTLYILDEPTTGLHFEDIRALMQVLNQLVDRGNTVLVIEHNMDVIKQADHIIELGPDAGERGGTIVFEGTPEELCKHPYSHTAVFLKEEFKHTQAMV
jgi:excinuclease ABC subunit A